MKYLIVIPQLGFTPSGNIIPGGLLQLGRCVIRALSSSPSISTLAIWCQVDLPAISDHIRRMLSFHAHPNLKIEIKCFGGSKIKIATSIISANIQKSYDRVMYLLVNQSVLSLIPWYIPYDVWLIGEELFHPISKPKFLSLSKADRLLCISHNTTVTAIKNNSGLPLGDVVHLCIEPPIYDPLPTEDNVLGKPYDAKNRDRAVLIVANMHARLLYKGHQQLIAGWPKVINIIPDAELWIIGDGDGRRSLEKLRNSLPTEASEKIFFFGYVNDEILEEMYDRCRVFAMPSTREGFGIVFIEAARHGVPCIGGKHDSVKEIVVDNHTGILVEQQMDDIANSCIKLLEDDELANRMGNAGRQRYLENFQYIHFRKRLLSTLNLSL